MATERNYCKEGGYVNRRVGKRIMQHSVTTAELVYAIIDDITDGDADDTRALKAANELGRRNVHLFDVGAGLMDADMPGADASSQRMVGEPGKDTR